MTPYGDPTRWLAFEADEGCRTRVEKLDECLAIYAGLMAGQPFAFEGKHFTARPTDFFLPDRPRSGRTRPSGSSASTSSTRSASGRSSDRWRWNGLLPRIAENG